MNHWDERILQSWSKILHIDISTFTKTGLVVQVAHNPNEPLMVYTRGDLKIVVLPQQFTEAIDVAKDIWQTLDALTDHLQITVTLQERDFIYYATTPLDVVTPNIRVLTHDDAIALDELQAQCTPEEQDLAKISIDDPFAVGYFEGNQLVGVASFLEEDYDLYDIGVITHPTHRAKQIGEKLAVYVRNNIIQRGKIAQYITMESNRGSVSVAEKAQFELFIIEEVYTFSTGS